MKRFSSVAMAISLASFGGAAFAGGPPAASINMATWLCSISNFGPGYQSDYGYIWSNAQWDGPVLNATCEFEGPWAPEPAAQSKIEDGRCTIIDPSGNPYQGKGHAVVDYEEATITVKCQYKGDFDGD